MKRLIFFLCFCPIVTLSQNINHWETAIFDFNIWSYLEGNYEPTNAVMMADIRVSTSTFFVTTGTHGAHVLIGIIGLTYMTWKAWMGRYTPKNAVSIEYFGLYWHFVDLVWVLVFPFFYLY